MNELDIPVGATGIRFKLTKFLLSTWTEYTANRNVTRLSFIFHEKYFGNRTKCSSHVFTDQSRVSKIKYVHFTFSLFANVQRSLIFCISPLKRRLTIHLDNSSICILFFLFQRNATSVIWRCIITTSWIEGRSPKARVLSVCARCHLCPPACNCRATSVTSHESLACPPVN